MSSVSPVYGEQVVDSEKLLDQVDKRLLENSWRSVSVSKAETSSVKQRSSVNPDLTGRFLNRDAYGETKSEIDSLVCT